MSRGKLLLLVTATAAFDLFVLWAVGFTIAWGGMPPMNAIGFWTFALSPFIVSGYCMLKVRAFKEGGNPRI